MLAEVPLTMLADLDESNGGLPTLRRRAIDLVFLEKNGWVIVDYKSDRVNPTTVKPKLEYYRPQVESYAKAWAKLVGQQVSEIGLFFIAVNTYATL